MVCEAVARRHPAFADHFETFDCPLALAGDPIHPARTRGGFIEADLLLGVDVTWCGADGTQPCLFLWRHATIGVSVGYRDQNGSRRRPSRSRNAPRVLLRGAENPRSPPMASNWQLPPPFVANRHNHPGSGVGNVNVCVKLSGERVNDAGAEARLNRPVSGGEADAVISHVQ